MSKRSFVVALVVLGVLLAGCSTLVNVSGSSVTGSGKFETRDYALSGFTGISACCGFQLTVTGGDAYKVSVTADDNILDVVRVRQDGNMLRFEMDNSRALSITTHKLEAAVTMPTLQALTLSGGSQFKLGASAPKVVNLTVDAGGGSQANLAGIAAQKVNVTLTGGSTATVHVTGTLDYDISGGSQLHYTGNPALGSSKSSGGSSASEY